MTILAFSLVPALRAHPYSGRRGIRAESRAACLLALLLIAAGVAAIYRGAVGGRLRPVPGNFDLISPVPVRDASSAGPPMPVSQIVLMRVRRFPSAGFADMMETVPAAARMPGIRSAGLHFAGGDFFHEPGIPAARRRPPRGADEADVPNAGGVWQPLRQYLLHE